MTPGAEQHRVPEVLLLYRVLCRGSRQRGELVLQDGARLEHEQLDASDYSPPGLRQSPQRVREHIHAQPRRWVYELDEEPGVSGLRQMEVGDEKVLDDGRVDGPGLGRHAVNIAIGRTSARALLPSRRRMASDGQATCERRSSPV
jgi:hypothetical protein